MTARVLFDIKKYAAPSLMMTAMQARDFKTRLREMIWEDRPKFNRVVIFAMVYDYFYMCMLRGLDDYMEN